MSIKKGVETGHDRERIPCQLGSWQVSDSFVKKMRKGILLNIKFCYFVCLFVHATLTPHLFSALAAALDIL